MTIDLDYIYIAAGLVCAMLVIIIVLLLDRHWTTILLKSVNDRHDKDHDQMHQDIDRVIHAIELLRISLPIERKTYDPRKLD